MFDTYWLVPLFWSLFAGAVVEAVVVGGYLIWCARESDREAEARRDVADLYRSWGLPHMERDL